MSMSTYAAAMLFQLAEKPTTEKHGCPAGMYCLGVR